MFFSAEHQTQARVSCVLVQHYHQTVSLRLQSLKTTQLHQKRTTYLKLAQSCLELILD